MSLIPIHGLFNYGADTHGVLVMVPLSSDLVLVTTYDGGGATGRGRVMVLDITTGQITQLGPETALAGAPAALWVFNGRIYIGTFSTNLTAGKVYWVRLGDVALTDALLTLATGEGVIDMITFLGNLYAGTSAAWPAANPISSHIYKYTNSTAAWTIAATNSGTATGNQWGPFILSSDGLTCFVFYTDRAAGVDTSIKKTTDGVTWTSDYDIDVNVGATYQYSGRPVLDSNGDLYWPILDSNQLGKILKRTAAGVWSIDDAGSASTTLRGALNILRPTV